MTSNQARIQAAGKKAIHILRHLLKAFGEPRQGVFGGKPCLLTLVTYEGKIVEIEGNTRSVQCTAHIHSHKRLSILTFVNGVSYFETGKDYSYPPCDVIRVRC